MFAKLLKYEWKATAGLLGILSLVALGCGVMGGFILRFIMSYAQAGVEHDTANLVLMAPLTILLVFTMLALLIYMAAVYFLLLRRFYKNKFTDEGYLTFTLPASGHRLFLSSLTNMLIWSLLSGIVLGLALLLMVGIGTWGMAAAQMDTDIVFDAFAEDMKALQGLPGYLSYRLLSLLGSIVSWLANPVQMMSCITIGAVLAKKHKILTAVGVYYVLNIFTNVITGTLSSIMALEEYHNSAVVFGSGALTVQGLQILLTAGLAAGGYFLSVYLMDKKLNLP